MTLSAIVGMLTLAQRRLIYYPGPGPVPPAARAIPGASDVTLRTSDNLELGAWLVPPRGTDTEFAVLVANGNAGDRSMRAPLAEALAARGFTVLLFDYRGYGGNRGTPSEEGLYRDIRAAYRHLVDTARFPPERIILYGESLGAAVVTDLAVEHPAAGLVLRSPFTDLAAVGSYHYPLLPVRLLLREKYPVAQHVARLRIPTVVVFGERDSIVPTAQSREVAAKAAGPVWTVEVPGADHNDFSLLAGDELINAVVGLAGRL